MIIHHTDCGFTYFSNNDQVIAALKVKISPEYPREKLFDEFLVTTRH